MTGGRATPFDSLADPVLTVIVLRAAAKFGCLVF
jgi:hypothetical protein